jgi:hypothetical protein
VDIPSNFLALSLGKRAARTRSLPERLEMTSQAAGFCPMPTAVRPQEAIAPRLPWEEKVLHNAGHFLLR